MAIPDQRYQAISLDFDGTLLNSKHTISSNNTKILRQLHELGIQIILASGRMSATMVPTWKILNIPCWVISYNGAQILRADPSQSKWKLYHSVGVSAITYKAAIKLCTQKKIFLNIYTDKGLFAYQPEGDFHWSDFYSEQTGAVYEKMVSQEQSLPQTGIIKLLTITPGGERQPMIDEISGKFTRHCQIIKSNPEFAEFHHPSVNKGNALKIWSELSGIPCKNVVAFGDAENDLEMLQLAGLGIGAKNATPGLKKSFANFSKLTNDQDFVSRELQTIFSLQGSDKL